MAAKLRSEDMHRQDVWTDFYPDTLLPQLQQALAALANVEIRYEADRESLQAWTGPEAIKDRLIAQLEERYRREREPYVARLEQLQREIRCLILAGL